MKAKKKAPVGEPGRGAAPCGADQQHLDYSRLPPARQAPLPAATLRANARALLEDPDPEAKTWAAILLDLAAAQEVGHE